MKKRFYTAFFCIFLSLCLLLSCNTVPDESDQRTESSTPSETPVETPAETPAESPDETGSDEIQDKTIKLDLSEYTMVYPVNASKDLKNSLSDMSAEMGLKYGLNMDVAPDTLVSEKEILVGATGREESAKALEGVEKDRFVIALIGERIVINSADDELTAEALGYFVRELEDLSLDIDGAVVTVSEDQRYVSPPYTPFVLWSTLKAEDTTIVYDKLTEYYMTKGSEGKTPIEETLAQKLALRLKILSAGKDVFYVGTVPAESSDIEICIGNAGRTECREFLESLDYNEYGFEIRNGKVLINGTNLTTLELAMDMFIEYINGSVVVSSDKKTRYVTVRDNVRRTAWSDQWTVDVPEFEWGRYEGTYDSDLGRLLIYYTDVEPTDFEAYCKKLETSGYELWQRNDIAGNLHAGYLSEENFVYVYYTEYEGSVRIITAPAEGLALPDTEPSNGDGGVEPTVTQLYCDATRGSYGMGYIITLEDGSFMIIDGGDHGESYEKGTGAKRIYDKLCELNNGKSDDIVIAAWLITHFHVDHYGAFFQFCQQYGKDVTIEKVLFNSATKNWMSDRYFLNNYDTLQVKGAFELVELLTGMKFYVRNAEFEVLCTNDDVFPLRIAADNDTTTVTRMTLGGETVMWLGDGQDLVSNTLCFRYGGYLKSDIVQVAHHGGWGCSIAVYALVEAETVLWPNNTRSSYENMLKSSYSYYKVNSCFLKHAERVIVSYENATITLGKE